MNRVRDLPVLAEWLDRRVLELQQVVVAQQRGRDVRARDRAIAFVVIESHGTWASFSRALFLSCALGARHASGSKVTVHRTQPPSSVADALTVAVHAVRPRKRNLMAPWSPFDEPKWHVSDQFAKAIGALKPSNEPEISGALGLAAASSEQLRVLRNFYAHRSESTSVKVSAMARTAGLNPALHPTSLALDRSGRLAKPYINMALDDIRSAGALMCGC